MKQGSLDVKLELIKTLEKNVKDFYLTIRNNKQGKKIEIILPLHVFIEDILIFLNDLIVAFIKTYKRRVK